MTIHSQYHPRLFPPRPQTPSAMMGKASSSHPVLTSPSHLPHHSCALPPERQGARTATGTRPVYTHAQNKSSKMGISIPSKSSNYLVCVSHTVAFARRCPRCPPLLSAPIKSRASCTSNPPYLYDAVNSMYHHPPN